MMQPQSLMQAIDLVAELVAGGVRHIVTSPGSRNAPLLYAAAAAAQEGLVELHTRIDERSAGFFAIGLSFAHGHSPVALFVTSGTAVANLHPAVLEACHAGIALVVVSADRPGRLHGTGANQTTDHVGLFTPAAPTVRVGGGQDPRVSGKAGYGLTSADKAVVQAALHDAVGRAHDYKPVHINVECDEPLTATILPDHDPIVDLQGPVRTAVVRARAHISAQQTPQLLDGLPARSAVTSNQVLSIDRTVVVAGHDAYPQASELANAQGWPLLAEVTSRTGSARFPVRNYRQVVADHLARQTRIDQIIVVGRPTLSREVVALLNLAQAQLISIGQWWGGIDRWANPQKRAVICLDAVPRDWLVPGESSDGRRVFARSWMTDGPAAESNLLWDKRAICRAVMDACGPDDVLVVGPSTPIRVLDGLGVPVTGTVVANRGLAGIDGVVSTARGVARGWRQGRVRALMGDVTFLYDAGGLMSGLADPSDDLVIVVLNDGGGTIFAGLEHGQVSAAGPVAHKTVADLFITRQQANIGQLCAGYGVEYRSVSSVAELTSALRESNSGMMVIEADLSSQSS